MTPTGPLRILLLSHTARTAPFRVGSHHLAREFARLGHRVAHVSNPVSLAHATALRDPEVRTRIRSAVPLRLHQVDGASFAVGWSVFPLTPDPLGRPLTLGSTTVLRRLLTRGGHLPADLVLVDQPLLGGLLDALPHRRVVYRPTDVFTGDAPLRAEAALLRRAAGVVATSEVVADRLARHGVPRPAAVVGNGVEHARLAGAARPWEERRGLVYVGALDRRFDWQLVGELGTALPEETVDLYGPAPAEVPVALPANVRLRGAVGYDRVPDVLGGARVGLLPLNADPTNDGRSPMKLFEYLAAGLTVLGRRTDPLARHGLADVSLYPAGDAARAVRAARSALDRPPTGDGAAAAAEMDWSARARRVLDAALGFPTYPVEAGPDRR